MASGPLDPEQLRRFERDGYLIVEGLLDREETELLGLAARGDARMQAAALPAADAEGRRTDLTVWNHPGDDIYGAIARSHRVVNAMEQLLGDEVYHYHSKLSAKQPKVGGAWEWHQDYGYWYDNGCLWPDMASLMIAIDPSTTKNGCLKVIRESHRLGRIEHGQFGNQIGADPQRVDRILERHSLVECEMQPGDGLYFHANILHASSANRSDRPRWALICCYNTAHNDPYIEHHHPRYTPLRKLPDTAIKQTGARESASDQKFVD